MVIALTKQAGAKGDFRHESQTGHALGPSTTVVYVYRQQMRQKKDVVYGLLFLLSRRENHVYEDITLILTQYQVHEGRFPHLMPNMWHSDHMVCGKRNKIRTLYALNMINI